MEVNYEELNLVNLSNSILKYFGVKPFHNTIERIDKILEKGKYKNVILFVCDGLGFYNLRDTLNPNDYLRKKCKLTLSSVFPPTTTAATTSLLSGLTPIEHNWFGWDMYFKDTNETISLFKTLTKEYQQQPTKGINERSYMKYKNIIDIINTTDNNAYFAYPFSKSNKCMNIDEVIDRIRELTKINNKKFIYAYIENPDKLMHQYGIYSNVVKNTVKDINDKLEKLSKELKDTIILVTADHGLIPTKTTIIKNDLPKLYNMLERTTSLEARCVGVKLKSDVKKEDFLKLYNDELICDFKLLSGEEVIQSKLFGNGDSNYLRDTIGDYLLIATNNISLNYDENSPIFKANHAGITKKELEVPLIILDCK